MFSVLVGGVSRLDFLSLFLHFYKTLFKFCFLYVYVHISSFFFILSISIVVITVIIIFIVATSNNYTFVINHFICSYFYTYSVLLEIFSQLNLIVINILFYLSFVQVFITIYTHFYDHFIVRVMIIVINGFSWFLWFLCTAIKYCDQTYWTLTIVIWFVYFPWMSS